MLVINRKKAKKALTLTIKRPEEKTTLPPTEIPKPMEMVKSDIVPRLKTEEYKIYGEAGSPKDAIREIYKTTAASPEVKAVQKAKGFVTSNLKKTQEKAASIIPIEAAKNALLFIGKVHRKVIKLPFDAVLNELTQRPNAYKAAMLLQKASAQETLPEHDVYDPVTKQKLVTKSEYE